MRASPATSLARQVEHMPPLQANGRSMPARRAASRIAPPPATRPSRRLPSRTSPFPGLAADHEEGVAVRGPARRHDLFGARLAAEFRDKTLDMDFLFGNA